MPLLFVGLGALAVWAVFRLSEPNAFPMGHPAAILSKLELPESLEFLEARKFVVAVSVGLAVMLWLVFRRPRQR